MPTWIGAPSVQRSELHTVSVDFSKFSVENSMHTTVSKSESVSSGLGELMTSESADKKFAVLVT